VARSNEGTHDLHAAWMPERLDDEARQKLAESLHSPERGAKIAAAQRGKKRPPDVVEKMRRARKGLRHSATARAKIRASHLERYAKLGRWTAEEDAQLGTMPDRKLAKLLGRHKETIRERRSKLGIASFRKHGPSTPSREWTPAEDALLGTMTDPELAARLGCTWRLVYNRRVKLGVASFTRG
jgi:hypothetical protein